MSDYSYIVTNEEIKNSTKTISFKVRNLTTIPLDLDGFDIKFFIENNKKIALNDTKDIIINTLKELELIDKDFIIAHTSDFSGIPVETYQAAYKKGELILESIYFNDDKNVKNEYNKAFKIMEYNPKFVREFNDFYIAKIEFEKEIKNYG